MQWGSIAEIVAAVCTIITVFVSVLLAVQQIGERGKAQALLASELERARRSDAEAVTAWIETRTSPRGKQRSEEHTSELQSLMRISYAVFCLKKKNTQTSKTPT